MDPAELVPLPELDEKGRGRFEHAGRVFAVFLVDGEPVVTDGLCPHRQGALSEGLIRDGAVTCPSHWYVYDLRTGQCRTTPEYHLARYPVVERDGAFFAAVPPARARRSWSEVLRAHAREDHA